MKVLLSIVVLIFMITSSSCGQNKSKNAQESNKKLIFPIQKSEEEWKKVLSPQTFEIMVKRGTEPPFKNAYNSNKQKGIYVSAATGEPLFSSEDKYESGSGWPSFTKAIKEGVITVVKDNSHGMTRDEIIETKTGLHLGHVFNDGPRDKGGKRYCMNSAALKFIKK
jgi:peptide-methionine (R)-S-oxide reductase